MKVAIVRPLVASLIFGLLFVASPAMSAPVTSAPSSLVAACGVESSSVFRVLSRDQPCVIALAVGHSFTISLSRAFRWSGLHASSPAVTEVLTSGPRGGGLTSLVTARAKGRITLVATGFMACVLGTPCPALARLWSLVVLVGATPSSAVTLNLNIDLAYSTRQYWLRSGDRLTVHLFGPSTYTWRPLVSSVPGVLSTVSSSGGSIAVASFVARDSGRTVVSAVDNPRCYPLCLAPSRIVSLQVNVSR